MTINKHILIEDLVRVFPRSVRYLSDQRIKCLACGEPIWGTLEDAAKEKGYSNEDVARFVRELNALANGPVEN